MLLGTIIFVITYSVDLSAGQSGTYFKACRQTEIRWRTGETIDGLHLTPRRACWRYNTKEYVINSIVGSSRRGWQTLSATFRETDFKPRIVY